MSFLSHFLHTRFLFHYCILFGKGCGSQSKYVFHRRKERWIQRQMGISYKQGPLDWKWDAFWRQAQQMFCLYRIMNQTVNISTAMTAAGIYSRICVQYLKGQLIISNSTWLVPVKWHWVFWKEKCAMAVFMSHFGGASQKIFSFTSIT